MEYKKGDKWGRYKAPRSNRSDVQLLLCIEVFPVVHIHYYWSMCRNLWLHMSNITVIIIIITSIQILAFFQYKSPYQTTRYY